MFNTEKNKIQQIDNLIQESSNDLRNSSTIKQSKIGYIPTKHSIISIPISGYIFDSNNPLLSDSTRLQSEIYFDGYVDLNLDEIPTRTQVAITIPDITFDINQISSIADIQVIKSYEVIFPDNGQSTAYADWVSGIGYIPAQGYYNEWLSDDNINWTLNSKNIRIEFFRDIDYPFTYIAKRSEVPVFNFTETPIIVPVILPPNQQGAYFYPSQLKYRWERISNSKLRLYYNLDVSGNFPGRESTSNRYILKKASILNSQNYEKYIYTTTDSEAYSIHQWVPVGQLPSPYDPYPLLSRNISVERVPLTIPDIWYRERIEGDDDEISALLKIKISND